LALLSASLLAQPAAKPGASVSPGQAIYLASCAFCHGTSGEGGRGPNLVSGPSAHGTTPADLRRVIAKGVPGTPMPSFRFEPAELSLLVSYLRGFRLRNLPPEKATGSVSAGKAVYDRLRCSACHRIGDAPGSVLGPALTRIGSGRSLAHLRQSIVDPSADVPRPYRAVTVVTADGSRVSGIRVNEDTFTLQIRNLAQQFLMYQKSELQQFAERPESLMPPYNSLPPKDLDDLVAYLASLRGGPASGAVRAAEGIR
jgi:putative heme-binding domain-containing protein